MKPDFSIVIPAYNEEKYIQETLEAIFHSDFSGLYEVIIVCNGCTDATAEIAEKLGAKVFTVGSKGTPEAMNFGASQAKAETLIFLDADTLVSQNLLQDVAIARMQGYIGGRTVIRWSGNSLLAKLSPIVSYVHKHKWGGFCFIDKKLFDLIGGYRSGVIYGFDSDLSLRTEKKGKKAFLNKSYVISSNRRFEKEGWITHLLLAIKRYYIDTRIFHKGLKTEKEIEYINYR